MEEKLNLTQEWDKTFPQSSRAEHRKVTFHNRYGITLAADLYAPKGTSGKLPAIAVCGPFGAVKEQSSGLYAQTMAERGFLAMAFDPSFTGESGGTPRYMASPDINTEDFQAAVDYLSLRDDVDPEKIGIIGMVKSNLPNICRSGLLGTAIGAIPGVGEDVAAWLSYDTARRSSKEPEKFGKGSFEGIIASECANNAAIGGALIPLLSLAIPGSPPSAVLLGALQLHGIRPGPMLTFDQPEFIPYMAALLLLASFLMRFSGWGICQIAPKLLRVPFFILMPVVGVLSIIGAYALNVNMFDLTIMFVFGVIGYFFTKLKIPAAPHRPRPDSRQYGGFQLPPRAPGVAGQLLTVRHPSHFHPCPAADFLHHVQPDPRLQIAESET